MRITAGIGKKHGLFRFAVSGKTQAVVIFRQKRMDGASFKTHIRAVCRENVTVSPVPHLKLIEIIRG